VPTDEFDPENGGAVVAEPAVGEIRRTIFRILWPATVESVLQMGVGLVNTGMVGHLSALAIGAVGLSNRATMVSWALFQAISTGATVLVAQAIGAGQRLRARVLAVQAVVFGTFSILGLGAFFFLFAPSVLSVFGPERELLVAGTGYLRLVTWGMPAVGIMTAVGACLRGSGDTRSPMVVASIVNIINVFGNWVLIYGHLGFPAMGITGSAIATILAQWFGAFLALKVLTGRNSPLGLTTKGPWRLNTGELRRILGMGLPAAGESIFWQAAAIILTFYITSFGTKALAAHQLGLNAESLSYMPAAGFSIAATTLIGQAIGAQNFRLARRYSRELSLWATSLTVFTASLLFFLPRQILALLTTDQDVIALGSIYLRLMAIAQVPQQLGGVLSGIIRGSGDTRAPMYIAAAGLWGIRLPLAYLLAFPLQLGITGVWAGMTLDLIIRFILTFIRYSRIPWVAVNWRSRLFPRLLRWRSL